MSISENEQTGEPHAQRLVSRRGLLGKALSISLAAPVVVGLMAACGSDDNDEPTATAAGGTTPTTGTGDATATTGETVEATPTEAMTEPTETTGGDAEPTATSGETDEPTATTAPEPTDDKTARLMGFEIVPAEHEGGTLVVPWQTGGDLTTSPFSRALSLSTMDLVFESMVDISPFDLSPVPNLATSWEVTEDGLIWTFPLREGVPFHDGETFNAEDVVYTYTTNMELFAETYSNIAEIVAVDDYTVEFTLAEPYADFVYRFATNDIVAEHVYWDIPPEEISSHPIATGGDMDLIVGTGPFRMVEFITDDTATFERFDEYWDGRPHLDRVVSITATAGTVALNLLRAGDIDAAEVQTSADAESLRTEGFTVLEVNPWWSTWYHMNVDPEKTTLFQDKRVRQAMHHALDREGMLLAAWDGIGQVAHSITSVPRWSPEGAITVQYPYDPDRANALLDEAGWLMGDDGVREKDGQKLSFEILCYQGWAPDEREAPIMQENWRQVGIEALPYFASPSEWNDRLYVTRDYEVGRTGWIWNGAPGDLESIFGCASLDTGNSSGYCNPEVDELLKQGSVITDPDERAALYIQAQNMILEDLPLGMNFHLIFNQAMSPRIHNVYPSGFSGWHFNAEEWWVEE